MRPRIVSVTPAAPGWRLACIEDDRIVYDEIAVWALVEWLDESGERRTKVVAQIAFMRGCGLFFDEDAVYDESASSVVICGPGERAVVSGKKLRRVQS